MPSVDVLDDTFVRADRGTVRRETAQRWDGWLPGLRLVVDEDRGDAGVRWTAAAAAPAADLAGTAEVWLEAVPAGTVVHLYVRLDPRRGPVGPVGPVGPARPARPGRRDARLADRLRRTWKRGLHRSKDLMEGEWSG